MSWNGRRLRAPKFERGNQRRDKKAINKEEEDEEATSIKFDLVLIKLKRGNQCMGNKAINNAEEERILFHKCNLFPFESWNQCTYKKVINNNSEEMISISTQASKQQGEEDIFDCVLVFYPVWITSDESLFFARMCIKCWIPVECESIGWPAFPAFLQLGDWVKNYDLRNG